MWVSFNFTWYGNEERAFFRRPLGSRPFLLVSVSLSTLFFSVRPNTVIERVWIRPNTANTVPRITSATRAGVVGISSSTIVIWSRISFRRSKTGEQRAEGRTAGQRLTNRLIGVGIIVIVTGCGYEKVSGWDRATPKSETELTCNCSCSVARWDSGCSHSARWDSSCSHSAHWD